MVENFKHLQTAHCENGVITNLLNLQGQSFITEPLVFGIGSGLFYIHIPFIKVNYGPAISFRTMPGRIFKNTCSALNIEIESRRFRKPEKAKLYLDDKLAQGFAVGCQVGVFNLSYFPVEYRFHFNAHNLIVYGKEGNDYLISDPVMETFTRLTEEELQKVRFAKGMFAPNGHIYYIKKVGRIDDVIIKNAIKKGIQRNVRDMLYIPGSIAGVKGIKYTSRKIRKWRNEFGVRKAGQYLGHIVRMQEEIGTGGGGFRYIYAAFIEEAAKYFKNDELIKISDLFTKSGDLWRSSAIEMAGVYKGRATEQNDFNRIADMLIEISELEKVAFQELSKMKLIV